MTGKRRRGQSCDTWHWVMKREFEAAHGLYNFERVKRLAQDISQWKIPMDVERTANVHHK